MGSQHSESYSSEFVSFCRKYGFPIGENFTVGDLDLLGIDTIKEIQKKLEMKKEGDKIDVFNTLADAISPTLVWGAKLHMDTDD